MPSSHRWWKWLLGAIGFTVVLAALFFIQPWTFLPHQHIIIRVPYAADDLPSSMIPMGETIYHPKPQVPNGHPGIDFGWNGEQLHAVHSSSAGTVSRVTQGASEPGKWDIDVSSGFYVLRYKEMENVAAGIAKGTKVSEGDTLGNVGVYCERGGPQPHCWSNLHWELASSSVVRDRFCPVTYLDPASRASLEALWEKVPSTDKVKSQFPDICSGDYKGKVE